MPDPTATVTLGATDVRVTRLGLGSTPFGNLLSEVSDTDARTAIETAWDLGLRYFDTAPFYGYGLAEERVGAVLSRHDRGEFTLSTKIGRLVRPGARTAADEVQPDGRPFYYAKPGMTLQCDYSFDGVRRSLEESLARLGLDRADIVFVHDPDLHFDETVAGALKGLEALREEGTVRAIGAGMNQWEMQAAFLDHCRFDAMLLAGRYSLLEQPALDELLPKCVAQDCSIILGGVFNSGLLADPWKTAVYNYQPAPPGLVDRAKKIEAICKRHDVPLKAAALQFPLGHPAIASILIGVRSAAEVRENHDLFQHPIPMALWDDLKREGLLSGAAPTPPEPAHA